LSVAVTGERAVPRRRRRRGAARRPRGGREGRGDGRFSSLDRTALTLWLLTRVTTLALVSSGAWLFSEQAGAVEPVAYLDRWLRWDAVHYATIAEFGYDGDPRTGPLVPLHAFLPGLPLLLRGLHAVGIDITVAGLLVSFVAGGVAVVALARLAALEIETGRDHGVFASSPQDGSEADVAGPSVGTRAVLLFLLAPSAVFLAAGYSEALFLAFALPAWLAARRGRWAVAGLLAAGAASTRVSGAFLAVALLVEFLTAKDGRRRWARLPWLALPLLPLLAYTIYLHGRTGDWLAWQHAQEEGWFRSFTWPWDALQRTWGEAFGATQTLGFAWMFGAEILAVGVGLVLTGWLLHGRRWGEATYVGLQVVAFTTSVWFFSVPRATLLWWPLWIGLAVWSLRRRWVLMGYLTVFAPFMVVFTLLFSLGRWAG
jgi:hypothetical protein